MSVTVRVTTLLLVLLTAHCTAAGGPPGDWQQRHAAGKLVYSRGAAPFMPDVANGYVGTVALSDWLFLAGVFNGKAKQPDHRAQFPAFRTTVNASHTSTTTAAAAGAGGGAGAGDVWFALDFERGVFESWRETAGGGTVQETVYAHRAVRELLVHTVRITGPATVAFNQSTAAPSSPDFTLKAFDEWPWHVVEGRTLTPETPDTPLTLVTTVSTATNTSVVVVAAGESKTFTFYQACVSSLSDANPTAKARAVAAAAVETGASALLAQHEAAWLQLWEGGRVEVGGNLPLALTVNASLFYIMTSARADWPYGLSPGGLARAAYEGHTFWDQETWMFPPLVLVQPAVARSLLEYRHVRLPQARAKAQAHGYDGAWFPWESAQTGVETCAVEEAQYEQHIVGDIALACQQLWRATADKQWLAAVGAPIVNAAAAFWASRVVRVGVGDANVQYGVKGVQGPDEYAWPVNNSAYTNAIAALTLRIAIEANTELNASTPDAWREIADNMYVPFDESRDFHPEFDGYRNQTVKQADVIMLQYPLAVPGLQRSTAVNDNTFYYQHTTHSGPAMTWAIFAINWLRLGEEDKASALFDQTHANAQPPFYVWQETPTGGATNFITGAGGFLQLMQFGYLGLELHADGFRLAPPAPPPNTTSVAMHGLQWRGAVMDVSATDAQVSVRARAVAAARSLGVTLAPLGQTLPLVAGGAAVVWDRTKVTEAVVAYR